MPSSWITFCRAATHSSVSSLFVSSEICLLLNLKYEEHNFYNLNTFNHSKFFPGSVFLSDAISLCPTTASKLNRSYLKNNADSKFLKHLYCASSKIASTQPSSSIPIEKSLQLDRPRQLETPACHARLSKDTNCVAFPFRSIYKWGATLSPSRSEKEGSSSIF